MAPQRGAPYRQSEAVRLEEDRQLVPAPAVEVDQRSRGDRLLAGVDGEDERAVRLLGAHAAVIGEHVFFAPPPSQERAKREAQ
jgi:hypothetical protein